MARADKQVRTVDRVLVEGRWFQLLPAVPAVARIIIESKIGRALRECATFPFFGGTVRAWTRAGLVNTQVIPGGSA